MEQPNTAAAACTDEELIYALWSSGRLRHKLDLHQQEMYDHYRAWEERAPEDDGMGLVYVLDCGRRVGKTYLIGLIKTEDCLRRPGSICTYATAYQKDINEIIIPIFEDICRDAPESVRPEYQGSKHGMAQGYYFPNGSVLRLVGIDMHPRALRGRASDGFAISEAAFVKGLANTVGSIIYPQFQRRPWARLILESSAPEDPEHDFDRVFVPDAKLRGAYLFRTIDDNTALSAEEKERYVSAARAIDPDSAEREYYGKRIRNRTKVVVPEFDEQTHVKAFERPPFAIAMAAMDPGMRDLFALLWGYWDARRAKLCIERDWCQRNASTRQVAAVVKETETELYGAFSGRQTQLSKTQAPADRFAYWNGAGFVSNPVQRVSDTEARLIGDLTVDYGIEVINTLKDDKEAAVYALRSAIGAGKVEVHPRCRQLIAHLNSARWNEQRTDYERSEIMGHYDLLDALVYLWRMVQPIRNQDPYPPERLDKNDVNVLFHRPPEGVSLQVKGLQQAFEGRRRAWR